MRSRTVCLSDEFPDSRSLGDPREDRTRSRSRHFRRLCAIWANPTGTSVNGDSPKITIETARENSRLRSIVPPEKPRNSAIFAASFPTYLSISGSWRRERDSNPRDGFPSTHFPGVRLRPLGHPSVLRAQEYIERRLSRTCLRTRGGSFAWPLRRRQAASSAGHNDGSRDCRPVI